MRSKYNQWSTFDWNGDVDFVRLGVELGLRVGLDVGVTVVAVERADGLQVLEQLGAIEVLARL